MQPFLSRIRNAFAIQLGHLAVFRILLGLIVAWDLWGRFQLRTLIFGDSAAKLQVLQEGLLPSQLSAEAWTPWNWSLLWLDRATDGVIEVINQDASAEPVANSNLVISDWQAFFASTDFASGLLIAGIVLALLYSAGLFTKVCNFLLWIIVVSVQVRMPLFTTGADTLAKLFLFWSLWLPVSAVWSADAHFFSRHGFWRKRIHQTLGQLKANQPDLKDSQLSLSTFATAAIMLQFIAMYFFTGLAKCNPQWFSGGAISEALQWSFYVRPQGDWLSQQHWLLTPLTWLVLAVELLAPVLVFVPGIFRWTRRPTAWTLIGMHLGIAATMTIGTFSAIAICGWLLFFGSLKNEKGWRWLWYDNRDQGLRPVRILVDSPRAMATARDYCIAILGVLVLWWNFSVSKLNWTENSFPDWLKPAMYQLALNQDFPMFAEPIGDDWRWSHALPDGQNLRDDLPSPVSISDRPPTGFGRHEEFLWRQLHVNLLYCENQTFKQNVAQRLVQWERGYWQAQQAKTGNIVDAEDSQLLLIDDQGQINSQWWKPTATDTQQ